MGRLADVPCPERASAKRAGMWKCLTANELLALEPKGEANPEMCWRPSILAANFARGPL